jgi:hypothetical protein
MYPAQALFDGLYTVDDLPDSFIVKYGQTLKEFKKGFGLTQYAATYAPEDYSGGFDAIWQDGGLWNAGVGLPEDWGLGDFPCLFGSVSENLMEDQFADTYTILDVESGQTIIVNRKSLCLWEEDNGGTRLFYNFGGPPPYNQYGAEIPRLIAWYIKDTPNRGDEGVSLPFSQQVGYGLGRLNTPVGNYGNSADDNPNSQIVYTVS